MFKTVAYPNKHGLGMVQTITNVVTTMVSRRNEGHPTAHPRSNDGLSKKVGLSIQEDTQ